MTIVTIALIIIGFIVDLLKTLVALKKAVSKKKKKKKRIRTFSRLTRVNNQRENKLESKNAAFYSFSSWRNFHLKNNISRE